MNIEKFFWLEAGGFVLAGLCFVGFTEFVIVLICADIVTFLVTGNSNPEKGIVKTKTIMEQVKHGSTAQQVFHLLKYTFVVLPIAAGADKFMHLLTDWNQYVNPDLAAALPFSVSTFMQIVGVIEIIAGIIVLMRPRLGGFIVAAWLAAIALTLLAGGMFLDIAVRDLVMAIAAFSMARLAKTYKA